MADYWVSKNKWYCKYCNVYIADDKPSRLHHETGMRHKGNLERYIRDIYKKGQQKEKDKADEAKELSAIEAAAAKAMGLSVEEAAATARAASGSPAPSASTSTKAAASAAPAASSSSDPYSNYSTAESLGYIDLEAQKAQREKEAREKERELRDKEGRAGEWTVVSNIASTSKQQTEEGEDDEETLSAERKMARALEDPDRKKISFSYLKEKSLPADDDDEYDKIAIKVRAPKIPRGPINPLSKAMDQARTQAPPGGRKASAKANAQLAAMKFRPVQASGDYEEEGTEEELLARQQAAWDLIAPANGSVKEEEDAQAAVEKSNSTPMFKKKRKAGGADSESAKRRTT